MRNRYFSKQSKFLIDKAKKNEGMLIVWMFRYCVGLLISSLVKSLNLNHRCPPHFMVVPQFFYSPRGLRNGGVFFPTIAIYTPYLVNSSSVFVCSDAYNWNQFISWLVLVSKQSTKYEKYLFVFYTQFSQFRQNIDVPA